MDGAFGESCSVRNRSHAGANMTPFISCGLPVKVQVNHKRGGLLIVPDQITHQDIEHVIVDRNGAFETRISRWQVTSEESRLSAIPLNGQRFLL